uniref:Uncharacterized protein n=1 Tax=Rhodopseudomonas palustris (strain DX-1) TaxID=652103 RepID=E6VL28_RHOPX
MSIDLRTRYNEWLMSAQGAVRNGDKRAAMFCLGQAMSLANRVRDARYRRAVMRAMNHVRTI